MSARGRGRGGRSPGGRGGGGGGRFARDEGPPAEIVGEFPSLDDVHSPPCKDRSDDHALSNTTTLCFIFNNQRLDPSYMTASQISCVDGLYQTKFHISMLECI